MFLSGATHKFLFNLFKSSFGTLMKLKKSKISCYLCVNELTIQDEVFELEDITPVNPRPPEEVINLNR
jgi:hypothetical protein